MIEFACPVCDGHELDTRNIKVEETDTETQKVIHIHYRMELQCRHCGWFGSDLQTTKMVS